ncbi:hypothetical protein C2845_PM05G17710 [Panicum miliaceum]|uniref:FBD domain-containing protein n=1 Tax=Panicum miliaceum TaxID=4540 RepID=A0A3L6SW83_PANMI|nr:hypothetical protein C2845_PM05G17710 [Panicum miliaceum]
MSKGDDGTEALPERANEWLRYAGRHVVEAFRLQLPRRSSKHSRIRRILDRLPPYDAGDPAVLLPGHGRMASITMDLSSYRLLLPAAAAAAAGAKYEALTELELSGAAFDEDAPGGGGRTLGAFVSYCCPRLRKLDICFPRGLPQLVIRSETLEELRLSQAEGLRTLDVAPPSLRVLKLEHCFHDTLQLLLLAMSHGDGVTTTGKVVRIAAPTPRLEEIAISHLVIVRHPPRLDIHDRAGVRRLSKLHLYMHGPYCCDDDGSLWLLENCHGVEHVDVSLVHGSGKRGASGGLVDLTAEGAAPFAKVRSMVVRATLFSGGHLVSSLSALLSRCPLLRSLSVRITKREGLCGLSSSGAKCFCDEVATWKFHQKFFLGSLEEVTIHDFVGADEDMDLLTLLFESSSSIRKVTLHATAEPPGGYHSLRPMMGEDDEDYGQEATEIKLLNIPSADGGCWHFGEAVYTWTC